MHYRIRKMYLKMPSAFQRVQSSVSHSICWLPSAIILCGSSHGFQSAVDKLAVLSAVISLSSSVHILCVCQNLQILTVSRCLVCGIQNNILLRLSSRFEYFPWNSNAKYYFPYIPLNFWKRNFLNKQWVEPCSGFSVRRYAVQAASCSAVLCTEFKWRS